MALTKVQNMTLVAQPTDGVCWWASAQMCYKWSQTTGKGKMVDPLSDETGFAQRFKDNGDWFCGSNGHMADKFKMQKYASLGMDFATLNDFMSVHGPIFTSVQKNWNGNNYSHAVVICGVADTGVFIHDPMPVNTGGSCWLTWDQINKAIKAVSDVADYGFLTAV
jgi:hypothetical protein